MKPGMLDFKHEVLIHNLGEVPANFSYELNSLVVFGKYVDIGDGTSTLSKFESRYPFIIKTSSTKELLSAGDYLAFDAQGGQYPISASKFDSLYEPTDKKDYWKSKPIEIKMFKTDVEMEIQTNEGLLRDNTQPQIKIHSAQEWSVMVLSHETIKDCLLQPNKQDEAITRLSKVLTALLQ